MLDFTVKWTPYALSGSWINDENMEHIHSNTFFLSGKNVQWLLEKKKEREVKEKYGDFIWCFQKKRQKSEYSFSVLMISARYTSR